MAKIVKTTYLPNAFWDSHQKDRITAIVRTEDERGRATNQTVRVAKYTHTGAKNPQFQAILDSVGETQINRNTTDRQEKKQREEQARVRQDRAKKRTQQMAELYNAKLEALEVPEIKETKNTELLGRMRTAKSMFELEAFAILIVMEELGYVHKPKRKAPAKKKSARSKSTKSKKKS